MKKTRDSGNGNKTDELGMLVSCLRTPQRLSVQDFFLSVMTVWKGKVGHGWWEVGGLSGPGLTQWVTDNRQFAQPSPLKKEPPPGHSAQGWGVLLGAILPK